MKFRALLVDNKQRRIVGIAASAMHSGTYSSSIGRDFLKAAYPFHDIVDKQES